MYSAPVLVMRNGQMARPLGAHEVSRSKRFSAVGDSRRAGSRPSAQGETAAGALEMHKDLEDAGMDVSAWIREWNDRATWIQHLGDRARGKGAETPLGEALQQAALKEHKKNKVLHWNQHASEREAESGTLCLHKAVR